MSLVAVFCLDVSSCHAVKSTLVCFTVKDVVIGMEVTARQRGAAPPVTEGQPHIFHWQCIAGEWTARQPRNIHLVLGSALLDGGLGQKWARMLSSLMRQFGRYSLSAAAAVRMSAMEPPAVMDSARRPPQPVAFTRPPAPTGRQTRSYTSYVYEQQAAYSWCLYVLRK